MNSLLTANVANPGINWIDILKLILEYIWIPIGVPILIFVAKKIGESFLSVKEIKKATDKDAEGFRQLYNTRIKEELRIDAEEILKFVGRNSNSNVEHHLFVCKHKGGVVGFIKFMISKPTKYLFIAYIAVDKEDRQASDRGVEKMVRKIIRKYFKDSKAHFMITEIEQGPRGNYNTSLAKLIARYAKAFKFDAYYIDVPYIQPQMLGEESTPTEEDFLSLIFVPFYKMENGVISKTEFINIIEFIYFGIYGPSCNEVMCDCGSYNKYLIKLVEEYKRSFNDYISLIQLGGTR